jgi:predicted small lipoprotein YifL
MPLLRLAVLIAIACLGACGQKGPLYLPDQPAEQQRRDDADPAQAEPDDEARSDAAHRDPPRAAAR